MYNDIDNDNDNVINLCHDRPSVVRTAAVRTQCTYIKLNVLPYDTVSISRVTDIDIAHAHAMLHYNAT